MIMLQCLKQCLAASGPSGPCRAFKGRLTSLMGNLAGYLSKTSPSLGQGLLLCSCCYSTSCVHHRPSASLPGYWIAVRHHASFNSVPRAPAAQQVIVQVGPTCWAVLP